MLYVFTGNGNGEALYDKKVVEISDSISRDEVQTFIDEWKENKAPSEALDQFGDIDFEKMSINDVVALFPDKWDVTVTDYRGDVIFI